MKNIIALIILSTLIGITAQASISDLCQAKKISFAQSLETLDTSLSTNEVCTQMITISQGMAINTINVIPNGDSTEATEILSCLNDISEMRNQKALNLNIEAFCQPLVNDHLTKCKNGGVQGDEWFQSNLFGIVNLGLDIGGICID